MEKQILDVLKSRRFITILIGLVVMLVVAAFPAFASAEEQIIASVTFIVLLAIGGYSATDIALMWLSQPGSVATAINAAAAAIDASENFLKIDIPESMETAAKEELRKVLQRLVDNAVITPVEVNISAEATR